MIDNMYKIKFEPIAIRAIISCTIITPLGHVETKPASGTQPAKTAKPTPLTKTAKNSQKQPKTAKPTKNSQTQLQVENILALRHDCIRTASRVGRAGILGLCHSVHY